MPLLQIWKASPEEVDRFSIQQIVAIAGDGILSDNSLCSDELRSYLSDTASQFLRLHANTCLDANFQKSGFVLQDIVNELGRRLGYRVENGRYHGVVNAVGFDGIWELSTGESIVVETKTTDAFRINLDVLANYRAKLIENGRINEESSILVVVGRDDTGDIEAQIRGSRHAWKIRIISVEALLNLVAIKEAADQEDTLRKIRNVLRPFEYTRLDNIIDVLFSTTRDVEAAAEADLAASAEANGEAAATREYDRTPVEDIAEKKASIISALGFREETKLITHKRSMFWNSGHDVRAVCTISKRYDRSVAYWYAYHPAWDDFLSDAVKSFFVMGCMDKNEAYAVPHSKIREFLPSLHLSEGRDGKRYWHLHLQESGDAVTLLLYRTGGVLSLAPYALKLSMK